jgi:outer membrane lipoprotein SlyB
MKRHVRWLVPLVAIALLGACATRPAGYARQNTPYDAPYNTPYNTPYNNDPYNAPYDARHERPYNDGGRYSQPPVYSPSRGGHAAVEYGRVRSIDVVNARESNSGGGALLGGLIGAIVGRQFGNSSNGRATGTFAGAVGGALIGNEVEANNRGGRDHLRISIWLDRGGVRDFAVPHAGDLRVGDRVRIEGDRLMRM